MLTNTAPTEAQLDELRTEHGDILEVESEGLHVVLAKPPKANRAGVYQRFMEKIAEPKTRAEAMTGLFKACVVFPSKDDVISMLAEEPGLGATFGPHCTDLLGIREAQVKKG